MYEVAAPDVVAISVNVPVLPWLRSTEIPVAEAELSTHDWVSWPAMVSACQMRTDRARRTAMATQWDGLFGDSTASLLQAVCAAQPKGGSVFARQLCRRIPGVPGLRPVALRPTLSDGLPLSGYESLHLCCKVAATERGFK